MSTDNIGVAANTAETAANTEEIVANAQETAANAAEIMASTEEAAENPGEAMANMQEAAENTEEAAAGTEEAAENTEEAAAGTEEAVENMEEAAAGTEETEEEAAEETAEIAEDTAEPAEREFSAEELERMKADLNERERICLEAEGIAASDDFFTGFRRLSEYRSQWRNIRRWNVPEESDLEKRFKEARALYQNKVNEENSKNKAAKRAIIDDAASLADSEEWRATADKMAELMTKWKEIGSAGRDVDDGLWLEFKSVRTKFFERRKKHFEENDELRRISAEKKRGLIEQARELVSDITNFKETGIKFSALMDEWKTVGYSGRGLNDSLWEEFIGLRNEFNERRRAFMAERDQLFRENAEKKQLLADEAQEIARTMEFSKENLERMSAIGKEWKEIGYAGRDSEDALWNRLREAEDSFWNEKRSRDGQRHQEWKQRLVEALERKNKQVSDLEEQISYLEGKLENVENDDDRENINTWISEKRDIIVGLNKDIDDIGKKIAE